MKERKLTETEKMLRKEISRLEAEKEDMLRRYQLLENINYKQYREIQNLNFYIKAMEGARTC